MFIKQFYKHSKINCLSLAFFILLYCFINLKQGIVLAPIFQYGMYSGKFYLNDTHSVYKIFINDKPLDLSKFSFEKNDKIIGSLSNYIKAKSINPQTFKTVNNILSKLGISNFLQETVFSNNISDNDFLNWYKILLEKIIGEKLISLKIFSQKIMWHKGQLITISLPLKLYTIGTNN